MAVNCCCCCWYDCDCPSRAACCCFHVLGESAAAVAVDAAVGLLLYCAVGLLVVGMQPAASWPEGHWAAAGAVIGAVCAPAVDQSAAEAVAVCCFERPAAHHDHHQHWWLQCTYSTTQQRRSVFRVVCVKCQELPFKPASGNDHMNAFTRHLMLMIMTSILRDSSQCY